MADIITTLHKKGENTVNVYPNIKIENIPTPSITQDKIANGSVGSNQLENSSVSTAKIASSAVSSAKILNGAVTTYKISDGAVTTDKLANGAVDNSKLASNAVSTSNIVDGSVNANKIADGAVTTDKISNGAVDSSKLADSSVTSSKILPDSINGTHIQADSIDGDKLTGSARKLIYGLLDTYLIYVGNDNEDFYVLLGTTTAKHLGYYSREDIDHALNFDKPQSSYTNTDLDILALIIEGFITTKTTYGQQTPYKIKVGEYEIQLTGSNDIYTVYFYQDGVGALFNLRFDISTHTITSFVNTNYIYLELSELVSLLNY